MRAIFIDVHGVLLDFIGALADRIEREIPPERNDFHVIVGVTQEEFWRSVNEYHFWRHLPVCPFGAHVWLAVQEMRMPHYVITRPMPHSVKAIEGTMDRLTQDLNVSFEKIIVATDKEVCAQGAFLIDDEAVNCEKWRTKGGTAFQWPAYYNDYLAYGNTAAGYMAALRDLLKQLTHWNCSL